jgi:hypothetical protein
VLGYLVETGVDAFSNALFKAFSKKSRAQVESNSGSAQHLDENGLDVDALQEHAFCGGDYGGRFADDEEDHVAFEQESNVKTSEAEMTDMWRYDDAQVSDNEEEDSEDEAKVGTGEAKEGAAGASSGGGIAAEGMGGVLGATMVNEDMLASALAARKFIAQQHKQQVKLQEQQQAAEVKTAQSAIAAMGPPAIKRPRVEASDATSAEVASDAAGVKRPRQECEYSLSEAGIRTYVTHRGGRVSIKELSEVFKPIIKAYSKHLANKQAGREKFLDLLDQVVLHIDDPLLGKAIELREK